MADRFDGLANALLRCGEGVRDCLRNLLIAGAQLAHVIAGSVEAAYASVVGAIGWDDYARFILAALLGNTAGGVTFVVLLNHAQVKGDL